MVVLTRQPREPVPRKTAKARADRLRKKREYQKKCRDKLKRNQKKYEAHLLQDRERKRKSKEAGKLKSRAEMSERELRNIRLQRKKYRCYRARNIAEQKKLTPVEHEGNNFLVGSYLNSLVIS